MGNNQLAIKTRNRITIITSKTLLAVTWELSKRLTEYLLRIKSEEKASTLLSFEIVVAMR